MADPKAIVRFICAFRKFEDENDNEDELPLNQMVARRLLFSQSSRPVDLKPAWDDYQLARQDKEDFVLFHKDAQEMSLHVTCQCQLTARGREELEHRQIPFVDTTFQCDCGSEITLPVPISPNDESRFQVALLLQQALRDGALDYLFASMHSRPSPENPEHGSSVLSALEKWSWDDDLRERINTAYQAIGLPKMCMFSGIRLRALLSLFHHSFTTCYESFHTFMEGLTAFKDANLDERAFPHWVTDCQLAGIMTWAQIAIAKFIAGEDDQRYANIRRDIA